MTKELKYYILGMLGNIVGKGKKMLFTSISFFSTMFTKGFFNIVVKSEDCAVNYNRSHLNPLPNDKTLDWSKWKAFAGDQKKSD